MMTSEALTCLLRKTSDMLANACTLGREALSPHPKIP